MSSLQIDEVPGMGQFDIDGLEEEDRNNIYGDVLAVMAFAVVIILSFGLSYAWVLSRNFSAVHDMDPQLMQFLSDM
jgi:ABC-type dipeptide/oligopeptide/nickel transport system permease component